MKIQELKNGTKNVTIPKSICELWMINKGDKVAWRINDNNELCLVRDAL